MIRTVARSDSERIAKIYNYYIEHTVVTFEKELVTKEEITERIEKVTAKNFPYLVYEQNGEVIGYAYLDYWRSRSAYDITLETSIYFDSEVVGKNLGSTLYAELIHRARSLGIHSLIGVISLPNAVSQKLHEKFNFRLVGNFRESGIKFDRLIDVEFWQLML